VRRWWVGEHLATLSVPRPGPGKAAAGALSLKPHPKTLTDYERGVLQAGIASASRFVERATGHALAVTGDCP
jgi:hypothetical protein